MLDNTQKNSDDIIRKHLSTLNQNLMQIYLLFESDNTF
jgi:hypothetical protein